MPKHVECSGDPLALRVLIAGSCPLDELRPHSVAPVLVITRPAFGRRNTCPPGVRSLWSFNSCTNSRERGTRRRAFFVLSCAQGAVCELTPDVDGRLLKINVGPLEPDEFAKPQPVVAAMRMKTAVSASAPWRSLAISAGVKAPPRNNSSTILLSVEAFYTQLGEGIQPVSAYHSDRLVTP